MTKPIYFTVGPSQIYPTVPKHLQTAVRENILSLNHRGSEFKQLFKETTQNLKKLLEIPPEHQIFFVSSALESMERTIESTVELESFHLITGSFGKSWMNIASQLGKTTSSLVIPMPFSVIPAQSGIPADKKEWIPDLVHDDKIKEAEVICITQNDTSTGFQIPMEEIYALKKKFPKKLIAVDVVSSVPCLSMDFKYLDVTFFSVQKGFGLPAGLGVIIVSPQALKRAQSLKKSKKIGGSYHNFVNLAEKAVEFQTPETPNVLNMYLFNSVLKDLLKTGNEKIRVETAVKSEQIYEFFDTHKQFTPAVSVKKYRSNTTIVVDVAGKSELVRKKLAKMGFNVGAGYGEQKENQIRIANFPAHSVKQVKDLLKLF